MEEKVQGLKRVVFNKEEIRNMIIERKLVEDYIDREVQLAPNGFDLTVGKIFCFSSRGSLDFSNSERVVPEGKQLFPKKGENKDGHIPSQQGSGI